MKSLLSLLLFLLICTCSQAQLAQVPQSTQEIHLHTKYYRQSSQLTLKFEYYFDPWSQQEIRHGRYSEWDTGGRITADGYYQDGKRAGVWYAYRTNGSLSSQIIYLQDTIQKVEKYFRNGAIRSHRTYDATEKRYELLRYTRSGKPRKIKYFHRLLTYSIHPCFFATLF